MVLRQMLRQGCWKFAFGVGSLGPLLRGAERGEGGVFVYGTLLLFRRRLGSREKRISGSPLDSVAQQFVKRIIGKVFR